MHLTARARSEMCARNSSLIPHMKWQGPLNWVSTTILCWSASAGSWRQADLEPRSSHTGHSLLNCLANACPLFRICIYLLEEKDWEREGAKTILSTLSYWFIPKIIPVMEVWPKTEAKRLELNPGPPHGWKRPNYLRHQLLLPKLQVSRKHGASGDTARNWTPTLCQ